MEADQLLLVVEDSRAFAIYQSMKICGGKALMSMKNFLTYEYVVHEDKEPGSKRCPTLQQIWSLKSNRDPVFVAFVPIITVMLALIHIYICMCISSCMIC